jgi:hypothetical protein
MLTLNSLIQSSLIKRWELRTDDLHLREFYFSAGWNNALNALVEPTNKKSLVANLSPKGRVVGFVDQFVAGTPALHLERPRGFAMAPMFKRMRPPNTTVVEMRTSDTRTFGFFCCPNIFVAMVLERVSILKADKSLYLKNALIVQKLVSRMDAAAVETTSDVKHLVTD